MHRVPLPRGLRDGVGQASDSPDDRAFVAWVNALPEVVATVAVQWQLDLGAPYEPGSQVSWVAPARGASGEALVLKLGWPHDETVHEPDALRLWGGVSAVRFVFTFAMPDYPHRDEPRHDLDKAGFGVMAVAEDGSRRPKEAFGEVARRYGDMCRRN